MRSTSSPLKRCLSCLYGLIPEALSPEIHSQAAEFYRKPRALSLDEYVVPTLVMWMPEYLSAYLRSLTVTISACNHFAPRIWDFLILSWRLNIYCYLLFHLLSVEKVPSCRLSCFRVTKLWPGPTAKVRGKKSKLSCYNSSPEKNSLDVQLFECAPSAKCCFIQNSLRYQRCAVSGLRALRLRAFF